VEDLEKSRSEIVRPLTAAEMRFDPARNVHSKDLEVAKKSFHENAEGVLGDITDDTVSVISAVFEQLKKLDDNAILKGLDNIGSSVQPVAAAGRLIRRGLEKLKNVLEAITNLFGKEAVDKVKDKVKAIWEKFVAGDYTRDAVSWLLNIDAARKAIASCIARQNLTLAALDAASNELPALSESFKKSVKICRALIGGLVLAGSIIGFLHFAAPWIPAAFAAGYGAIIASTIIIGSNYAGSGRLAHWMRGVATIADGIAPPPASTHA
jgi:hypothetical protein